MGELIATLIGLAILIEFLTEGVKILLREFLSEKAIKGKKKVLAFVVALVLCIGLPYLNLDIKGYQPLEGLNLLSRIVVAFLTFRGGQALHDWSKKTHIGD